MYISPMERTCSMYELGGINSRIINSRITKRSFYNRIKRIFNVVDTEESKEEQESEFSNCRAIIYNSNIIEEKFENKLKELGFDKIYSYEGNNNRIVTNTWMLNLDKLKEEVKTKKQLT